MSLTYQNGVAPDSALEWIDGTHVTPDVYQRVSAMQAYCTTLGIPLHVIELGGYANLAEQKARQTNNNKASTIPVALVGHSTHGIYSPGRVDLGSTVTSYTDDWLAQIIPIATAFGLIREFGAADPNHFMVFGAFNPPKLPEAAQPAKPYLQEDDMLMNFRIVDGDGKYGTPGTTYHYVSGRGYWWKSTDQDAANAWSRVIGQVEINVSYAVAQNFADAAKSSGATNAAL